MAASNTASAQSLVLVTGSDGINLIPAATPLTRLNYFDGKFLRAADLEAEQRYLRRLVELGNQAGGSGVVHGLDLRLPGGDRLQVSAGLAIDPLGHALLLPQEYSLPIARLIDASRGLAAAGAATAAGSGSGSGFGPCPQPAGSGTAALPERAWYLVTIAHAEALCGEEDVYGALCEQACVTATDRPYRVEGTILRARPLTLVAPLPDSPAVGLSGVHLRSRIASAYYADEAAGLGTVMTAAVLASADWCAGAAPAGGSEVPLGILVREGGTTLFVDQWIARRERMEAPPKRYWQWRMAMRPWDVYLAQILQFQCQLRDALAGTPAGGGGDDDPCNRAKSLVAQAADTVDLVTRFYKEAADGLAGLPEDARSRIFAARPGLAADMKTIERLQGQLKTARDAYAALPPTRQLIARGFAGLPPAGYLPVAPLDTLTVNEQVRRMMGEGVDLRFCIVRPDFVPHAVEEAQHLERISLIAGIDNPARKQEVDILVPLGRIAQDRVEQGRYYAMRLNVNVDNLAILFAALQALRPTGKDSENPGTEAAQALAKGVERYLKQLAQDTKGAMVFEYDPGAARADRAPDGALAFAYAGTTGSFRWGRVRERMDAAAVESPDDDGDSRPEARSAIWLALDLGGDPLELAPGASVPARGECNVLVTVVTTKGGMAGTRTVEEVLLRLAFSGDLQAEGSDVRPGRPEVRETKAVLSGQLTWMLANLSAGETLTDGLHLTEGLTVLRTAGTYGPTYKIELPEPSPLRPLVAELEVERDWLSATEARAIGTIGLRALREDTGTLADATYYRPGAQVRYRLSGIDPGFQDALGEAFANARRVNRQAFRAWQDVNPQVAQPTHPAHQAAIGAVRAIGTALGSSKFADLAAKRLFPAPTARPAGLEVLATLDWVLFHRRREKLCRAETPAPQVQTRVYGLYQVALTGDHRVKDLAQALAKGGSEMKPYTLDFVQTVELAAGIHAVASPHAQVQASWRQDVGSGAGEILGGVIASRGLAAAEGEPLARARMEALVEVVAPVTPPVLTPAYEVQTRVPDAYSVAGQDGIVVLATRATVATDCHRVYWLTPVPDKDLDTLLARGALAELPGIDGQTPPAAQPVVRALGTLSFRGQDTQPTAGTESTQIRAQWTALGLGCAPMQVLSYRRTAAGDAGDDLIESRSVAIAGLLGDVQASVLVRPAETVPGICPVVTLVRPLAVCLETYRLEGSPNEIEERVRAGDIAWLVSGESQPTRLGDLTFCPKSGQVFGGDIQALPGDARGATIWFAVEPGNGTVDAGLAETVLKLELIPRLGGSQRFEVVGQVQVPDGVDWPSNCPILAFVVLPEG